jgi:Tfp pilus assembly protein PilV
MQSARAVTLVEVMASTVILSMVLVGVLQGMLQSRRMTEGSVRQASVGSLVQGYLEQIKSIKYADVGNALPSSPATTPGTGSQADWVAAGNIITCKGSDQSDVIICLAAGAAPTTKPLISTLPTDASWHTESVDIDNLNSNADNSTLDMWVWVNDLTGTNVVKCKSIVVVYQWSVKDGGRKYLYSDMMRIVRSIVPTD